MRRRGNKSAKVPNVKLRPAQEGALPRLSVADHSTCWAQDSQAGSDDTTFFDTCPRPFKGAIICATGAMDKPTLFKQALELGATSVSAFTDRVTHLVAVDHGGAKYMCALERKIPIMTPSWITDNYKIWLRGDDVDMQESVKRYRLPIFSGVILCPSGITEITRRTQINKLLTEQGGTYLKNLERPVRVTHLLCSGDEETDKMRYAEKFNEKGEANVHLVWEEWFWDSLEFGGRFDEQRYQVRRPRPKPKLDQQATSPPPSSALPSECDEETLQSGHQQHQPSPQNLDEGDEELAAVKRLPEVTLQLWGGLLKQRGYEISDGELLRSPSKSQAPPKPPKPIRVSDETPVAGSVISQFRRSNSFAPPRQATSSSSRPQPFRRTRTTPVMNPVGGVEESFMKSAPPLPEKNGESSTSVNEPASSLFLGLKFLALGEAKSPTVRNAIEQNGGRMTLEMEDDEVDYIIVRLVSGSKIYREEHDESLRIKYRTECWLERCIFEDRICPPEDHVTFCPISIETPVPGAEDVNLSFSGFDQSEICWITRLLRALGMTLAPFFSRRSTHLLCPSGTGAKFDKACEWRLPVINMDWLAQTARTGIIPPVQEYLVGGAPAPNLLAINALNVDPKGKSVDRGKGKEVEKIHGGKTNAPSVSLENKMEGLVNHSHESRTPTRQKIKSRVPPLLLQRQSTVSPERKSAPSFGRPGELLGRPPQPRGGSSTSTPTRARPLSSLEYVSSQSFNEIPVPVTPTDPARRPSLIEIERERKQARIPSSKSPSPMKVPRQAARIRSLSPTKLSKEAAKALQENITSLLGKRLPPVDEVALGAPAGKRARPQRKTQARQPSDVQLSEISMVPESYGDSMSPFEQYNEPNLLDSMAVDETMRVMYEDPGQRDEKRRLMNLLKSSTPPETVHGESNGSVSARTRRSTRIAGF